MRNRSHVRVETIFFVNLLRLPSRQFPSLDTFSQQHLLLQRIHSNSLRMFLFCFLPSARNLRLFFVCALFPPFLFLGEDDPQVAEVLFNLSAVVGAQNDRLEETEELLHRCLEAQKRLHGPGTIDTSPDPFS